MNNVKKNEDLTEVGSPKTGYDDDDDGEKSINLKWWVDLSKVRDEYVIRTMAAICWCFLLK